MSITIRLARLEDLDAVRYIGFSTWPATYGAIKGARHVVEGLDTHWNTSAMSEAIAAGGIDVAEGPHGVVGMSEVDSLGEDLVMWKLYVLPSEHGTGIGAALVNAAKDRARERGCDLLTEYEPANAGAGGFYAKQGFQPTAAPWPGSTAMWLRWRDPRGE
ncbi:MAG: GNAT family N-acetyltransferase [Dermabacter sp.]|nr:GNAT family N-acetyltransferase [Dermabacter sp.]